jgi:hypothetical protein
MSTIRFTGHIHPTACKISLTDHPVGQWSDPTIDLHITFRTIVENGVITIECEMNRFNLEEHKIFLAKMAYDLGRTTVDLIALKNGAGLLFLLDTLTDENGRQWELVGREPDLATIATSLKDPGFDQIHKILLTNLDLSLVLRALIEGMTFFNRAPLAASNGVDGIREYFVPSGGKKEDGWEPMRENLRVSKDYLVSITSAARGPRHGDYTYIPGELTDEVTRRAWIVMNRFFEYLKRGEKQLPLSEFPILTL